MLLPYKGSGRIKFCEGGVEEIIDAGAVLGSDGEDWNADAMENIRVGFLRHGVDFVDGNTNGLPVVRRSRASSSSRGVRPAWLSTTSTSSAAFLMSTCAWRRICC